MLSAYRPLFRQAGARRLVASSLSARLAVGVFTLPLVLVAEGATGSYALAGVVTGTWDLGVALSAPLRGRLVDRVGARRALPPLTLVSAGALGVLPLLAQAESVWLLAPAALLSGLSMPPFVASMRLEWQALLGAGRPETRPGVRVREQRSGGVVRDRTAPGRCRGGARRARGSRCRQPPRSCSWVAWCSRGGRWRTPHAGRVVTAPVPDPAPGGGHARAGHAAGGHRARAWPT